MSGFKLNVGARTHRVAPLLFGLFLEDINFTCDGGLNANMVVNHSFDGIYMKKSYHSMMAIALKVPPKLREDRLRYWSVTGGSFLSFSEAPASKKNPWYARVQTDRECILKNSGYAGDISHEGECAMNIRKGAYI